MMPTAEHMPRAELLTYFWAKVERKEGPNDCWIWAGSIEPQGYGRWSWRENGRTRTVIAHRFAYRLLVGPVPQGLVLDHFVCDNRRCVNPAHLRPVTPRENTLRGHTIAASNRAKTHCKNGHPFEAENLRLIATGRQCRICRKATALRWYYRNKVAS